MNNIITTNDDTQNPFWHQIRNKKIFCRFNVAGDTKYPIDMQGNRGIGANASISATGTADEAMALDYPFLGISLMKPIMIGEQFLVCLDFDWKRSPNGQAEPEQLDLMAKLSQQGLAYETSHSGKGCHFWILCNEKEIPKAVKLNNNCEIEVFSGMDGQRANVLITDYDFEGGLKPMAIKMPNGIEAKQDTLVNNTLTKTAGDSIKTSDLIEILGHIPADDYHDWIQVGMIIKSEFGDDGYELWDEWSKKSDAYDPFAMGGKWESFKGVGLSVGTLIMKAKEYGYVTAVTKLSAAEDFQVIDPVTGEVTTQNPWIPRFTHIPHKLTPPNWLVDGFLADQLTIIAGTAGVGKTSCLVPLAMAVAGITSHLSDIQPKHNRQIIYVSEDVQQIYRIIYGVTKHCTMPNGQKPTFEDIEKCFHVVHTARSTPVELSMLSLLCDQYTTEVNGMKLQPLVVLDTASATFALESENDNSEVAKYVASIKENFLRRDIPVWVIAHVPKSLKRADVKDMSARGASAWEGDANAVAYLFEEDGLKERFMALGKHRYEAAYQEIKVDSAVHYEMVTDIYGDMVELGYRYSVLSRSAENERIAAKELAKEKSQETRAEFTKNKIYELILSHPEPTKTNIAQAAGKKQANMELIESMISAGELVLVDTGKKAHNNRPLFVLRKGNLGNFDA